MLKKREGARGGCCRTRGEQEEGTEGLIQWLSTFPSLWHECIRGSRTGSPLFRWPSSLRHPALRDIPQESISASSFVSCSVRPLVRSLHALRPLPFNRFSAKLPPRKYAVFHPLSLVFLPATLFASKKEGNVNAKISVFSRIEKEKENVTRFEKRSYSFSSLSPRLHVFPIVSTIPSRQNKFQVENISGRSIEIHPLPPPRKARETHEDVPSEIVDEVARRCACAISGFRTGRLKRGETEREGERKRIDS